MLIRNYYTILNREQQEEQTYIFRLVLNTDTEVYHGHFPDNPIAPGVCSLQMIKECLQSILLLYKLRLPIIKQCRFTRLLRPSNQELHLTLKLLESRWFYAEIAENGQLCMKIKAQYNY
ncbi:MAG: hydroxymyristoyl-ACP dehydratase [Paludibacteraceae bacterium]|nr:hydroxymyristoyl-ACP dehydratase [Paludibacteraceae bacterium]